MLKFQKRQSQVFTNTLKNLANIFDIFGQPPQFRILKRQKFTTLLGQSLTILLLIMCSLYLYFQFSELLNQTNPSIIISETQPQSTPVFQLNQNNFTFVFTVTNPSLQALSTYKKHFNVSVQACNRSRYLNESTQATQISMSCRNIPLEACSLDKHFSEDYQKTYFAKFRLQNLFCIQSQISEKDRPNLQGFFSADAFQYLQVQIMPCKNSTEYDGCSSEEEISKALSAGYYSVYLSDNLVKLGNSGRPYEDIINLQYVSLSSSMSKQIYSTFRMIDTKTDIGLIQQNYISDVCLVQSTIREFQASYNSQYFVQNLIFIEQRATNYQRSYLKIQNILGSVGGLWQIVTLTLSMLVTPIISQQMNLQIANRMFNFESCVKNNSPSCESQEIRCVRNLDEVQQIQQQNYQQQQQIENNKNRSLGDDQIEKRNLLKQFFKRKKKSLKVGLCELFCMNLGFKKIEKYQINYALQKILTKLDVVNILTKLQEIDKLKYILLSQEQLDLFNYIPKPLIPQEMFAQDFQSKLSMLEERPEFSFILQEEKPHLLKVEQAFYAYVRLQQKNKMTKIDRSILKLVGNDMIAIFRQINQQQDIILNQNSVLRTSSLNYYIRPQFQIYSPCNSNLEDVIISRTDNNNQEQNEQNVKDFLREAAYTVQKCTN